ncbi:sialin-like isoform X2 [Tenebrio molitor]|uniref:sialin-like isoform X2 n=1 Tax=Tenebrio molitor TaxID=7067 RepID=UPI003624767A
MESEDTGQAKRYLIPRRYVMVMLLGLITVSTYITRNCLTVTAPFFTNKRASNVTVESKDSKVCVNLRRERTNSQFDDRHIERYNWDLKDVDSIMKFFYLGYGLAHIPGGVVCDKYGVKHPVELSLGLTALGTLFTPVLIQKTEGNAVFLSILTFIIGLSQGILVPAAASMVAHWVPRRERATLSTCASIGMVAGAVINNFGTEAIIIAHLDWSLPFYIYGGMTLGLFLLWYLLASSNPHVDPNIGPVERFYLDIEMRGTVDHRNKKIPFCRIFSTLDVWCLIVIVSSFMCLWLYMISNMTHYLDDVLKLPLKVRQFWVTAPFLFMVMAAVGLAVLSDWAINKEYVNVVTMRKACTNVGCMGPAIYLVTASYAGCHRMLVGAFFIIAFSLLGFALPGFRLTFMDISPNYTGSLVGVCNGLAVVMGSFVKQFIDMVVPNRTLEEYKLFHWYLLFVTTAAVFFFVMLCDGTIKSWNQPLRPNKPATKNL